VSSGTLNLAQLIKSVNPNKKQTLEQPTNCELELEATAYNI